jgi:hypothetical protein
MLCMVWVQPKGAFRTIRTGSLMSARCACRPSRGAEQSPSERRSHRGARDDDWSAMTDDEKTAGHPDDLRGDPRRPHVRRSSSCPELCGHPTAMRFSRGKGQDAAGEHAASNHIGSPEGGQTCGSDNTSACSGPAALASLGRLSQRGAGLGDVRTERGVDHGMNAGESLSQLEMRAVIAAIASAASPASNGLSKLISRSSARA